MSARLTHRQDKPRTTATARLPSHPPAWRAWWPEPISRQRMSTMFPQQHSRQPPPPLSLVLLPKRRHRRGLSLLLPVLSPPLLLSSECPTRCATAARR